MIQRGRAILPAAPFEAAPSENALLPLGTSRLRFVALRRMWAGRHARRSVFGRCIMTGTDPSPGFSGTSSDRLQARRGSRANRMWGRQFCRSRQPGASSPNERSSNHCEIQLCRSPHQHPDNRAKRAGALTSAKQGIDRHKREAPRCLRRSAPATRSSCGSSTGCVAACARSWREVHRSPRQSTRRRQGAAPCAGRRLGRDRTVADLRTHRARVKAAQRRGLKFGPNRASRPSGSTSCVSGHRLFPRRFFPCRINYKVVV